MLWDGQFHFHFEWVRVLARRGFVVDGEGRRLKALQKNRFHVVPSYGIRKMAVFKMGSASKLVLEVAVTKWVSFFLVTPKKGSLAASLQVCGCVIKSCT